MKQNRIINELIILNNDEDDNRSPMVNITMYSTSLKRWKKKCGTRIKIFPQHPRKGEQYQTTNNPRNQHQKRPR
jgi:hypothetical protein